MGHSDERIAAFFSRVRFERAVLRAVNTLPYVQSRLNGLSPQSRLIWVSNNPFVTSHSELMQLLDEGWSLLGQLADHSRTVFEGEASGDAEIENFLKRLSEYSIEMHS